MYIRWYAANILLFVPVQQRVVSVGGAAGKLVRLGAQSVKLATDGYYNAIRVQASRKPELCGAPSLSYSRTDYAMKRPRMFAAGRGK